MASDSLRPVTLSELVATLSLVSDLGMGRPVERVLRQTVIAMRLADAAGVAPEISAATYYTSLLTWVACAPIRASWRSCSATRRTSTPTPTTTTSPG